MGHHGPVGPMGHDAHWTHWDPMGPMAHDAHWAHGPGPGTLALCHGVQTSVKTHPGTTKYMSHVQKGSLIWPAGSQSARFADVWVFSNKLNLYFINDQHIQVGIIHDYMFMSELREHVLIKFIQMQLSGAGSRCTFQIYIKICSWTSPDIKNVVFGGIQILAESEFSGLRKTMRL